MSLSVFICMCVYGYVISLILDTRSSYISNVDDNESTMIMQDHYEMFNVYVLINIYIFFITLHILPVYFD